MAHRKTVRHFQEVGHLSALAAIVLLVAPLGRAADSPLAPAPSRFVATVYGGAGQVSGSLTVLDTGNGRWMIDCGSFSAEGEGVKLQRQERAAEQSATIPVDPRSIAAVFLTHAHTDHVGRLPLLVEGGFRGPIYCTAATADLLPPMLAMQVRYDDSRVRQWAWSKQSRQRATDGGRALSLHWHAACRYHNSISPGNLETARCRLDELEARLAREDPGLKVAVCHGCAQEEVAAILGLCHRLDYQQPVRPAPGVSVVLLDAGHIPGSASVLFEVTLNGARRKVVFSGDVGNDLSPLFPGPKPAPDVDAAFIETTYGDTFRDPSVLQERVRFRRVIGEVTGRGHLAWIPAFALDRTQKILHELRLAQQEGPLREGVPIYCPSATALEITAIYRQHQREGWFREAVANDESAFLPAGLRRSGSMPKNLPRPAILITTSGMLDNGWSRRLLEPLLPDRSTALFLVGYQDPLSPGGLIKQALGLLRAGSRDQASPLAVDPTESRRTVPQEFPRLEVDGQWLPLRADVLSYRCFSGHGDAKEMDAWLGNVHRSARIVLVHGGTEELRTRAAQLTRQGWTNVLIAVPGQPVDLM
jgi:metallo-beta-lactamase family protein